MTAVTPLLPVLASGQTVWWLVGITGATIVTIVIMRVTMLAVLRVTVTCVLEWLVVTRAGMGAGRPAGEIEPLIQYLNGIRWGMRPTLAGIARGWTSARPYHRLVAAEGIGMALRIRRTFRLGPRGADAFKRRLPPTASMGVGVYHALVSGIREPIPAGLVGNILDGWDAFLRVESYCFGLVVTRYATGRTGDNEALLRRLSALALHDGERGFALAVGLGRAMHFVIDDAAERVAQIDRFGPRVAPYARVGLGIPLLNTAADDISRVPEALRAYPAAARDDIVAGLALFLAFAARYAGPQWLCEFRGLTPELEQALRDLEAEGARAIERHSPLNVLRDVRGAIDAAVERCAGRAPEARLTTQC